MTISATATYTSDDFILTEMPYKKETKILYDNYDLTNIRYFEHVDNREKINSRKMILKLFVCNGQCCKDTIQKQFYKCKLEEKRNEYSKSFEISHCPYIKLLLLLNEPRRKSSNYNQWTSMIQLLELRKKYGLYTDYVFNNLQKNISIEVYKVLKTIPEFSLKHIFNMQYNIEEIYDLIKQDRELDINRIFNKCTNNHFEYSLLNCYINDVKEYRDFLTCRFFREEEDIKYYEWKTEHKNDIMFIDIGDYYYFTNSIYCPQKDISEELFSISATCKDRTYYGYFSFKKSDIKQVIDYLKSHRIFSNQYINYFTIEKLEELI